MKNFTLGTTLLLEKNERVHRCTRSLLTGALKKHVEITTLFFNPHLTEAKKLVYIFFTIFCSPVICTCFEFPLEGGLEISADLIDLAED